MVDLRTPPHNGHLLVSALKRHRDKPVLHIGGQVVTVDAGALRVGDKAVPTLGPRHLGFFIDAKLGRRGRAAVRLVPAGVGDEGPGRWR